MSNSKTVVHKLRIDAVEGMIPVCRASQNIKNLSGKWEEVTCRWCLKWKPKPPTDK